MCLCARMSSDSLTQAVYMKCVMTPRDLRSFRRNENIVGAISPAHMPIITLTEHRANKRFYESRSQRAPGYHADDVIKHYSKFETAI